MRRISRHNVEQTLKWIVWSVLGYLFVIGWAMGTTGCTSVRIEPDPTPQDPQVWCIADSPIPAAQLNRRTGNRLLPELVRVIGRTSPEDGERLMVIRGVYVAAKCLGELLWDRQSCDWQPWPVEKLQRGAACGPEASALIELGLPTRGE
jgi:hypothetical protein